MKDPRDPLRFVPPLLYVLAALGSLAAGIAFAAYIPESSATRVPLSLGGFALYVTFSRLAIRSARRDIDAVWRDDGPPLPPSARQKREERRTSRPPTDSRRTAVLDRLW